MLNGCTVVALDVEPYDEDELDEIDELDDFEYIDE